MKKTILCIFGLLIAFPVSGLCDKPFNLALVNPLQVFDDSTDITGIRLNLLYGSNTNVSGLDLGFGIGQTASDFKGIGMHYVANIVRGNSSGLQLSYIFNTVSEHGKGIQLSAVNRVHETFSGVQLGIANIVTEDVSGLQLGIVNKAGPFKGVQLGIVNIGRLKSGLQIGIANVNTSKRPLPFFPIVNLRF